MHLPHWTMVLLVYSTSISLVPSSTAMATASTSSITRSNVVVNITLSGDMDRRPTLLLDYGQQAYLCYPASEVCINDQPKQCPEDCRCNHVEQPSRLRRSPRLAAAVPPPILVPSEAEVEAVYWQGMRTQGLSFGDPKSWRQRRRHRWSVHPWRKARRRET